MEWYEGQRIDVSKWIASPKSRYGPLGTIHKIEDDVIKIHFDGYDYTQGGRHTLDTNYHALYVSVASRYITAINTNYSPEQCGDTEDDI